MVSQPDYLIVFLDLGRYCALFVICTKYFCWWLECSEIPIYKRIPYTM